MANALELLQSCTKSLILYAHHNDTAYKELIFPIQGM